MIGLTIFAKTAEECGARGFLDFPAWYQYLNLSNGCQPQLTNINDFWLVVAAIVEIMIRLSALFAVGLIIFGGIKIITSQGSPEGIKSGRETILNAIIGLILAIIATGAISFIAGQFS